MHSRVFIVLTFFLLVAGSVSALQLSAPEGEASFPFLKLSLSPRSVALGGGGVALVDGIADADLNPAAAARDSGGIALGQGYPFEAVSNLTASCISWNIPWQDQRVTLQMRYLDYGNSSGYDQLDNPTASFSAHTLKLQAGTAGTLWDFAYGASVAYAQHNVADVSYGSGLVNLGLWRALPRGFAAGFSVMNADFWTSKAVDGSAIFPPTTLQGGLSYSRMIPAQVRVSVSADARKVNDENIAFPAGVEACWRNILSMRVGYPYAAPEAWPDFGLGLRWSRYDFEYAYQGNAATPGGHYWTLGIRY